MFILFQYVLNNYKEKTVEEAGLWMPSQRMSMVVNQLKNKNMSLNVQDTGEDDLILGASASPTTGEIPSSTCDSVPPLLKPYEEYDFYSGKYDAIFQFLKKSYISVFA